MRDVLHRKANFSQQAKLRFWELPAAPTTCWKGFCSASAGGLHINRERLWLFESRQWPLHGHISHPFGQIAEYKTNGAAKLDVECRSQSISIFSDFFAVYRQLANFSSAGVGLGMTNVCQSLGDPFKCAASFLASASCICALTRPSDPTPAQWDRPNPDGEKPLSATL